MEEVKKEFSSMIQLDTILCLLEMQAAIGNIQLNKLNKILKKKR